jgi:hypothetical protein
VPEWPRYKAAPSAPVFHFDVSSGARPDAQRARYEALDRMAAAAAAAGTR